MVSIFELTDLDTTASIRHIRNSNLSEALTPGIAFDTAKVGLADRIAWLFYQAGTSTVYSIHFSFHEPEDLGSSESSTNLPTSPPCPSVGQPAVMPDLRLSAPLCLPIKCTHHPLTHSRLVS